MSVADLGRVLVVIPTYNEAENLESLVARLRAAVPEADVLVVDDGSPDGTGEIADRLAAADPSVHVLHRTEKAGLGAAYIAGFRRALAEGYDAVVEMDADGSHAPEELPRLLTALREADLVIGSRWVPGGQIRNWPLYRQIISIGGSDVRAGAAAVPGARLDLGLPGVPPAGAGGHQARRGRLAGLLLPDRPGLEDLADRVPGPRGADHVHRARGRPEQDEPGDRRRGAVAGGRSGG